MRTETEKEFKELHQELLSLKLFNIANNISSIFYKYGLENYKEGMRCSEKIWNNNN